MPAIRTNVKIKVWSQENDVFTFSLWQKVQIAQITLQFVGIDNVCWQEVPKGKKNIALFTFLLMKTIDIEVYENMGPNSIILVTD